MKQTCEIDHFQSRNENIIQPMTKQEKNMNQNEQEKKVKIFFISLNLFTIKIFRNMFIF